MAGTQEEVDDAIAELEGMRRVAEADEAATVQLRKRLVGLQGTLRKTRQAADGLPAVPIISHAMSCSASRGMEGRTCSGEVILLLDIVPPLAAVYDCSSWRKSAVFARKLQIRTTQGLSTCVAT